MSTYTRVLPHILTTIQACRNKATAQKEHNIIALTKTNHEVIEMLYTAQLQNWCKCHSLPIDEYLPIYQHFCEDLKVLEKAYQFNERTGRGMYEVYAAYSLNQRDAIFYRSLRRYKKVKASYIEARKTAERFTDAVLSRFARLTLGTEEITRYYTETGVVLLYPKKRYIK